MLLLYIEVYSLDLVTAHSLNLSLEIL